MTPLRLGRATLLGGDCLALLRATPDASVDAVVTDPPAGIEFMGKEWDTFKGDSRQPGDPKFHRSGAGPYDRAKVRHGTTPSYGGSWEYQFSGHGFSDGGNRAAAPGFTSAANPMCRNCHKHKRGWKDHPGCQCAAPDFDVAERRLAARRIFVGFMTEVMAECFRVLRPGGHAVVWALPRTSHWTATAIEDAGFEVRDVVTHIFGTGFPKSLDVSKAIDKAAGAEPRVVGVSSVTGRRRGRSNIDDGNGYTEGRVFQNEGPVVNPATAPASEDAARWQGWGTALKPASEHWILARRPLSEPNVAANVLAHGTGALNIDGSRIGTAADIPPVHATRQTDYPQRYEGDGPGWGHADLAAGSEVDWEPTAGRWPANLVLSHSPECRPVGTRKAKVIGATAHGLGHRTEGVAHSDVPHEHPGYRDPDGTETVEAWECGEGCPVAELDRQSGTTRSSGGVNGGKLGARIYGQFANEAIGANAGGLGDQGGASRFFSTFRSSTLDRWDEPTPGGTSESPRDAGTADGESLEAAESMSSWSTDGYGSNATVPSPTDTKSTTEITTPRTTTPPISNSSPKVGTTTTTNDSASTTESPRESRSVAVPDAKSGSPSANSPSGEPAPTRATARPVGASTSPTGAKETESIGTPTTESDVERHETRFFYVAKASRAERSAGLDGFKERPLLWSSGTQSPGTFQADGTRREARNFHPTVKPVALMRHLCKLVTPPGGLVLDPFCGSGSTGVAALAEGFRFLGMEREQDYLDIAAARLRLAAESAPAGTEVEVVPAPPPPPAAPADEQLGFPDA